MLLDKGQLCVVQVLGHISDNTGNDGPGDAEPFLSAAGSRPLLNAFEQRSLRDVIKKVGHGRLLVELQMGKMRFEPLLIAVIGVTAV